MKTHAEVLALKLKWIDEGAEWDLEDEPGFEEHREELLAFRREKEAEWDRKAIEKEARLQSCRPAYPNFHLYEGEGYCEDGKQGITKRELICIHLYPTIAQHYHVSSADVAAKNTVAFADALLKRLAEG